MNRRTPHIAFQSSGRGAADLGEAAALEGAVAAGLLEVEVVGAVLVGAERGDEVSDAGWNGPLSAHGPIRPWNRSGAVDSEGPTISLAGCRQVSNRSTCRTGSTRCFWLTFQVGDGHHASFGTGIERLVTWITGVHHLPAVIPYALTIQRLYP